MADRRNGTVGRRGTDLWFKMFSSDYLTDGRLDDMPRESEGLLIRMWCVCNIEGSCPADPEALARKTRCTLAYVLHSVLHCAKFFDLRDGRYYSARMEREKLLSMARSRVALSRWKDRPQAVLHSNLHDAKEDANTHAVRSKKQEADISTKSKAFVPPALNEVIAYCDERKNAVNPQQWYDHYSSNGWKVGRNKMHDWRAAVRTWERMNGRGNGNYVERSEQKQRSGLESLKRAATEVFGWPDGGGADSLQGQPANGSGAKALSGGLAVDGEGLRPGEVPESRKVSLSQGEILPKAGGH